MRNKTEENIIIDNFQNQIAPPWAKFRAEMLRSFPSPYRGEKDPLADGIDEAIRELDKLKPEKSVGAAFLGKNSALTIDFENVKNSSLSQKMSTSGEVIK